MQIEASAGAWFDLKFPETSLEQVVRESRIGGTSHHASGSNPTHIEMNEMKGRPQNNSRPG